MARIIRIKSTLLNDGVWAGQLLTPGAYHEIDQREIQLWTSDPAVFASVGNGELVINKGADTVDDIADPIEAWNWLLGDELPRSDLDNTKIAVHNSPKPYVPGKEIFAVWTGAGDDLTSSPSGINEGPMLSFHLVPQTGSPYTPQVKSIDVRFDPIHGKVWIHEAYLSVANGGIGDYVDAAIIASATPLQTVTNLSVYVENNIVKPAFGSPSNATHGFAGSPVLIPRSFSKDGDWDYDGKNLIPNYLGTGKYQISTIDTIVHKYFNKLPCHGTFPFFSMTSDETALLPQGYFIRINAHNISNTTWDAHIIMEIYRERTYIP